MIRRSRKILIKAIVMLLITSGTNLLFSLLSLNIYHISAQETEEEKKYREELMKLQKEIEMLKLKILETKKSLKVFEDMILLGTLTGTKITVYYKNELKTARVLDISVALDGFEVSSINDKSKIEQAKKEKIVIYDEAEAIPGRHILDVTFTIKGEKTFKKTIRHEFEVERNIATEINFTTRIAAGSKEEKLPQDIDILVRSEKVKLLPTR